LITLRWGSATDVGMVREKNQDALLVAEPLFAVADGMGGHQGGEVASATALEVLKRSFENGKTAADLAEAVRRANAKVWDKAQMDSSLHGMGTTLTAIARVDIEASSETPVEVDDESATASAQTPTTFAVINVGDSRTYLLRNDQLEQLTDDHSFVEEMVRAGELSPDEAESHPKRNILTRALGVEPTVEADIELVSPSPGDRILLCSDGLVRELSDDQIASVLRRLKNPDEAARELVQQAKAHGGHDNITVVIVDVEGDETDTPVVLRTPRSSAKKAKLKPVNTAPRTRITARVLAFITIFVALIVIAAGSVVWYARASYYVGLEGEQLVIYRGRADQVLWFKPTVSERTNILTSQVPKNSLDELQKGKTQGSLEDAHQYIQNLVTTYNNSQAAAQNPLAANPATPATGTP
jgi:serine/threonine protein phosphatase PrpC